MLDGIRSHEIIVGAYSDRAGGVCPMLAAHRCGGRTSFISFARAWDRFARAKRARAATARELRALEAHLIASILAESDDADLGGAIAQHQTLVRERKADEARAPRPRLAAPPRRRARRRARVATIAARCAHSTSSPSDVARHSISCA